MSFEGIPSSSESETSTIEDGLDVIGEQNLRESVFLNYVNEQLIENFNEALEEVEDITNEEVEEWQLALAGLDNDHLSSFLAIPHELLKRRTKVLVQQGRKMGVVEALTKASNEWYDRGVRVAYHCSPKDIRSQNGGGTPWVVQGYEPDHRDGDVGMAYYSFDLANLYRKKNPQFIYLVCADTSDESAHKKDGNGEWGRAPRLDVITQVDFTEAMDEVEQRVNALKKEEEKQA